MTTLVYSGGGNPRTEISNLIKQIQSAGGGTLELHGAHVLDGTIDERVDDLTMDFGGTGMLALGDRLSVPALFLQPTVARTGMLRMISPRFDCSQGQHMPGTLSSSAICPNYYARLEIFGGRLYGGGKALKRSDSGISPLGIVSGLIQGTEIVGFSDLGIYVTGDGQPAFPGETILIDGVKIVDCKSGIDSKRGYGLVRVKDSKLIDCSKAFRMSWVGIDKPPEEQATLPPGVRMEIVRGLVRDSNVAFEAEATATLDVSGTEVVGVNKVARNVGGTITGHCKSATKAITEQTMTVLGKTYYPKTSLKVIKVT